MIEHKLIHKGQYKPYGEYFTVYEITTDESKEKVIDYCREKNLVAVDLPQAPEWRKNIVFGGDRFGDFAYYFRGYWWYDEEKKQVTICEPFCD